MHAPVAAYRGRAASRGKETPPAEWKNTVRGAKEKCGYMAYFGDFPVMEQEPEKPECTCFPCAQLAMAYVPPQTFTELYEPEVGFERGTIFKKLDLPFLGKAVDA